MRGARWWPWLGGLGVGLWATVDAWREGAFPGQSMDLYGTVWFFDYTATSLAAGHAPGHTTQMFFPEGIDLFARTGSHLLDAVLASPLTWALGSATGLLAWVTLLPMLTAVSVAWMARARLPEDVAAATGLLAATFPLWTYELHNGRPTQAFVAPAALAVGSWLRADQTRHYAVLAGLALAATGWGYWFYGYFLGLVLLCWTAGEALSDRSRLRRRAVTFAVTAIGVAPAVIPMALRARHHAIPGLGDDAVALDGPRMVWQLLGDEGPRMLDGPLWPLVVLVALAGGWRWASMITVGLLLSSGPLLTAHIPNPVYVALHELAPFFARLWFPYRALALVGLAAPMGAALALPARRWRTPLLLLLAGGSLAWTSVAQGRLPLRTTDATPPPALHWLAEQEGAVILAPFPGAQPAIAWQPVHRRPLFAGMGATLPGHWPEAFARRQQRPLSQAIASLAETDPTPLTDEERARWLEEGFAWVVLHPEGLRQPGDTDAYVAVRARAAARRLELLLGHPASVTDDRVAIWALGERPAEVPPRLRVTPLRMKRLGESR